MGSLKDLLKIQEEIPESKSDSAAHVHTYTVTLHIIVYTIICIEIEIRHEALDKTLTNEHHQHYSTLTGTNNIGTQGKEET